MKSWGYIRLDTAPYRAAGGGGIAAIKVRKQQIIDDMHTIEPAITAASVADEDPKNKGDKGGDNTSAVQKNHRPALRRIINQALPYDGGTDYKTGPVAARGDTIYIENLSHLSRDPARIGALVNSIWKVAGIDLYVVGVDMYTANLKHVPFFDAIIQWAALTPKRKRRGDVSILFGDGGGDGGGNGGC